MAFKPSNGEQKPLGIYIHIPFCRSKCEYCDFYSLGGGRNGELMRDYLNGLLQHIREAAARAPGYVVDTIYFGGGTPSFYGVSNLKRILAELQRRFNVARDAEITLEANPDSVIPRGMHSLVRAGFNRISIGVQSANDEHLRALGRPHNWEQAKLAVDTLVDNIVGYIGMYTAYLGGVDALVFTGGIGVHSDRIRKMVCCRLGYLGLALDEEKNAAANTERISTVGSSVAVYRIKTDEEIVVARNVYTLL